MIPDRRIRLLGDIDVRQCTGIEIGALHSPIVARAEGPVLYVDYAPTEELRKTFRHPGVDPASIVEVDIVWGRIPLREAVAEPVGYVVASHVIEHVPDLIGWLLELHAVLRPGGTLGLAIPDRRRTFDFYRNESVLAEMVEAHLLGYRQPSLRQVFEACAMTTPGRGDGTWQPFTKGEGLPAELLERLDGAYRWLKDDVAATPRYIDAHCWVFTPLSFLEAAEALARMGCFPFVVARFFDTEPGAIEFHVRLESAAGAADPAVIASILAARDALLAAAALLVPDDPVPVLRERLADLEQRNAVLAATVARMTASKSWRLTSPLRSVLSRIKRMR